MGLCLLLLAGGGVWHLTTKTPSVVAATVAVVLTFGATAYLWLYIIGVNLPLLLYLAVGCGLVCGATRMGWSNLVWRGLGLAVTASVILFGVLFGPTLSAADDPNFKAPLRTQAVKALGLYEYGTPSEWPDSIAFYEWAKNNTDAEALFYFNDRQYEFRAFAVRAVTHSWKDVGGGYYTPPLAIEYYRRFQQLDTAYEDPARLLACAEAYQADYIVAKDGQPSLNLPIAYANELYLVYAMDGSMPGDPTLCQVIGPRR